MKFKTDDLVELWRDEGEYNGLEFIECDDWVVNHKYEHCTLIFKFEGKHYGWHMSRSGSYYTDYYYSHEDEKESECYEVEQVQVVKIVWQAVKVSKESSSTSVSSVPR